jgi:hypothetical protein
MEPAAATPPDAPVPFFAPRPGAIPGPGSPTLAGVTLPAGRPRGEGFGFHWATDEFVRSPGRVLAELAEAFPQTGLWPLAWDWEDQDPDGYWQGGNDVASIAAIDVEAVMRRVWESFATHAPAFREFGGVFPRLAASAAPGRPPTDLVRRTVDAPSWRHNQRPGRQLLLVPCNRPADALAVVGFHGQHLATPEVCAVLRSWEERFSAVPIEATFDVMTLAVGAPPTSLGQARQLAVEMLTVATVFDYEINLGAPAAVDALAAALRDPAAARGVSSHLWLLNFDEII